MRAPLVSVMVPTYNRAHLIRRTLESCVQQTYTKIEIVVYDDGSTDNTHEIVESMNDRRIRYVKGAKNIGELPSRTELLKLARGEFGCWVDSDDMMNVWRVELQLETWKRFTPPFVRCAHVLVCKKNEDNWRKKPLPAWKMCRVTATKFFRLEDARAQPYENFYYNGGDVVHEYTWVNNVGPGLVLPFELYHQDARPKDRMTKQITSTKEQKHKQGRKLHAIMDPIKAMIRDKGQEPESYFTPNAFTREIMNKLYGCKMPLF